MEKNKKKKKKISREINICKEEILRLDSDYFYNVKFRENHRKGFEFWKKSRAITFISNGWEIYAQK